MREIRKFDDMFGDSYSVIVKLINWVLLVSSSRSRSVTNTQRISDSPIISDRIHHQASSVCLQTNIKSWIFSPLWRIVAGLSLKNNCTHLSQFQLNRRWSGIYYGSRIHCFKTFYDPRSIMDPLLQNSLFPYSKHNWPSRLPNYIGRHPFLPSSFIEILIHSLLENGPCYTWYGLSIITRTSRPTIIHFLPMVSFLCEWNKRRE